MAQSLVWYIVQSFPPPIAVTFKTIKKKKKLYIKLYSLECNILNLEILKITNQQIKPFVHIKPQT
jgi:hypothetical protein